MKQGFDVAPNAELISFLSILHLIVYTFWALS